MHRSLASGARPTGALVLVAVVAWMVAGSALSPLPAAGPIPRSPFRPGEPISPTERLPSFTMPRFVAYWVAEPGAPGCSDAEPCVASVRTAEELFDLIETRRERGLEIVRFDARITPAGSFYAGGWQRSDRPHELRLGLRWGTFLRRHQQLVRKGHDLVHLKLYEEGRRRRVAAIWRPADSKEPPAARARRAHDWQQLLTIDERLRTRGFHLAEIEAYPRPDGPDDRWAAGVWRAGSLETRLLEGLTCHSPHDVPVETLASSAFDGEIEAKAVHGHCGLLIELRWQAQEGFQAVDFENYMEAGEERWAVLLHRRSGADWLQFAGTELDVALRENRLDAQSAEAGFRLLDLDIYGLSTIFDFRRLHNGLVHDGGTSGPP